MTAQPSNLQQTVGALPSELEPDRALASSFRIHLLFAAAVAVHFGVFVPLIIYVANVHMFIFPMFGTFGVMLILALTLAGVTLGIMSLDGGIKTLALQRIIGFVLIYLIVGFDFDLFIDRPVLDGGIIDWASSWPRIVAEISIFLIGLFFCLRLHERYWLGMLAAVALYVLLNAGISMAKDFSAFSDLTGSAVLDHTKPVWSKLVGSNKFGRLLPFVTSSPPDLPNIDSYSTQKNVIIILVDTLQSNLAEELIEANDGLKGSLAGFTFFENSASVYPFTGMSVPAIHSGQIYKPGEPLDDFFARANAHRMDSALAKIGFDTSYLGVWARTLYAFGKPTTQRIDFERFRAAWLYRQLPITAKALYFDKLPDFLGNTVSSLLEAVSTDVTILRRMAGGVEVNAQRPQFKFIHLWGTHQPSSLDRRCEVQPIVTHRERYLDQASCILGLIGDYLEVLRHKGVFDASQIFIIADHGTTTFPAGKNEASDHIPSRVQSSSHPTLLFKDFGRTGPLLFSSAPVSLLDVRATILNRAGIKPEIPHDLNTSVDAAVDRRDFYFYPDVSEVFGDSIDNLQHYKIGPNVRDTAGWTKE
jgi:Sulfatase